MVVKRVHGVVKPFVEEEDAEVFIVVAAGGAVDHNTTMQTFPGLECKVGVVPGRSILRCFPGICVGFSRLAMPIPPFVSKVSQCARARLVV